MSNDFYNGPLTTFEPFTKARAEDVSEHFNAVAAGFEKLPSETDLKQGKATYVVAAGTANALTASMTTSPGSYVSGLGVAVKVLASNTGAATINLNGLGVKAIKRADGTALSAGDILIGSVVDLRYDGTSFRVVGGIAQTDITVLDARVDGHDAAIAATNSSVTSLENENAVRTAEIDALDERVDDLTTAPQVRGFTYGTYETAAVSSIISNQATERTQVNGFTSASAVASYGDRDSVAQYIGAYAPAPTQTVAAVSFTSTTVVLGTAASADVVVGMLVDTNDATKFTGTITAISGNRLTLTVSGWFAQGNTAGGQVPTGTPTLYINPITKVWGLNGNSYLAASSHAARAVFGEIGLVNNKGVLTYGADSLSGGTNMIGGFDVVNLGTYKGGWGYKARGDIHRGFVSNGNYAEGFIVEDAAQNPARGFATEASTGIPFQAAPGGVIKWQVSVDGSMDVGAQSGTAAIAKIKFHGSGGTTADGEIWTKTDGNAVWRGHGVAWQLGLGALTDLGNDALRIVAVASQVNGVQVRGAIAGGDTHVESIGADTDVNLLVSAKGAGTVQVGGAANKVGFFGGGGIVKPTSAATATDLASAITLANSLKTILTNLGLVA